MNEDPEIKIKMKHPKWANWKLKRLNNKVKKLNSEVEKNKIGLIGIAKQGKELAEQVMNTLKEGKTTMDDLLHSEEELIKISQTHLLIRLNAIKSGMKLCKLTGDSESYSKLQARSIIVSTLLEQQTKQFNKKLKEYKEKQKKWEEAYE